MSKRNDIKKVMIIGSGPIVIGQACEFDYSGTQACKALRECGYEIVLVNSNPATIMTDPAVADVTYIEPLNEERLEQIIAKERPDALLPNLGGQTGLNLAIELNKKGVLEKYGVQVIGVNLDAIERGEDRLIFKETMAKIGIDMPRSDIAYSVDEAVKISERLGFPLVVRPAYTMGGAGGGLVYNLDELKTIVARGLQASMTHQCLIEESILGWEELEVEVVRDATGAMISVCFIENVDPVGVHTGDSFCTAPMMTVPAAVQEDLQKKAWKIINTIGVIGGTNVQFARNPKDGRVVIIEINPRTSRSSALASKATGFPIALISAKLASGMTLSEIPYWRDGTLDKYTPSGDYVVVKFARWAFEKFKGVQDKLGTQMKAVGEVMSIGKNYKEAFQKAIRSLENGRMGLGFAKDFNAKTKDELLALLQDATSERHASRSASSSAGSPFPSAASKTPATISRPTRTAFPPPPFPPAKRKRSWCSAAARTASGRASSSTTAAATRRWRCGAWAMRRSWSTAIRKRFRPTTTRPTSFTSNRSRSKTCSPFTSTKSPRASSCSSAGRRRSTSRASSPKPA